MWEIGDIGQKDIRDLSLSKETTVTRDTGEKRSDESHKKIMGFII